VGFPYTAHSSLFTIRNGCRHVCLPYLWSPLLKCTFSFQAFMLCSGLHIRAQGFRQTKLLSGLHCHHTLVSSMCTVQVFIHIEVNVMCFCNLPVQSLGFPDSLSILLRYPLAFLSQSMSCKPFPLSCLLYQLS
jgi:hypothetical protein